ncbi:MAG: Fur family transcriptional regulator [bacterium]|nr:Fur family transcriptional regulator [bacterium]
MPVLNKNHKRRVEHFKDTCRENDIKLTHSRVEVFSEISKSIDHPDVETIHKRVKKRISTLSLDTVYRALWLIKDLGLLTTFGEVTNKTRFEANLDPHHHFICISCGMIRDFYFNKINNSQFQKHLIKVGKVKSAQLELRGICFQCTKKNQKI